MGKKDKKLKKDNANKKPLKFFSISKEQREQAGPPRNKTRKGDILKQTYIQGKNNAKLILQKKDDRIKTPQNKYKNNDSQTPTEFIYDLHSPHCSMNNNDVYEKMKSFDVMAKSFM